MQQKIDNIETSLENFMAHRLTGIWKKLEEFCDRIEVRPGLLLLLIIFSIAMFILFSQALTMLRIGLMICYPVY